MHDGPGLGQSPGGGRALLGISGIGAAQAGEIGAGFSIRGDHLGRILEAVMGRRLDTAGLVKILGEHRARREIGELAERSEKHLRPRPGLDQSRVGFVAQSLERLGQPNGRQRLDFGDRRMLFRGRDARDIQHRREFFAEVGIIAGADQRVLAARDRRLPGGADGGYVLLDQAAFQRGPGAAGFVDLLEPLPRSVAKRLRQRLDGAGARRRIGDLGEMRFLEQHQLRVARHAPGESVRQAERKRVRQRDDVVGAAKPGGGNRDGRAQHVHIGVAFGQHPPRGLGGDRRFLRRQTAGLLDARPQFANGAEFGHGQELVGVGGEPEIDHAPRGIERDAAGFKRAQAIDRGGERKSQLLRFRSAGIVNDAAVGNDEGPGEALLGKAAHSGGEALRQFAPRLRAGA